MMKQFIWRLFINHQMDGVYRKVSKDANGKLVLVKAELEKAMADINLAKDKLDRSIVKKCIQDEIVVSGANPTSTLGDIDYTTELSQSVSQEIGVDISFGKVDNKKTDQALFNDYNFPWTEENKRAYQLEQQANFLSME